MKDYSGKAKNNKIVVSFWFFPITVFWFLLSAFLGWLSSLFFLGRAWFLYFIYGGYQPYVIKYDLFCLSAFYAFVLLPCAVFFYWEKGFLEIHIKNKWLIPSIMLGVGGMAVFTPPDPQGPGKYVLLVRIILAEFDWLGALFINFVGLYLVALAIVLVFSIKNVRG